MQTALTPEQFASLGHLEITDHLQNNGEMIAMYSFPEGAKYKDVMIFFIYGWFVTIAELSEKENKVVFSVATDTRFKWVNLYCNNIDFNDFLLNTKTRKITDMSNTIELSLIKAGTPEDLQLKLRESFEAYEHQAQEVEAKANSIVVIDHNDIENITKAEEARKAIVKVRTSLEAKRKEVKEHYLRGGQAVDHAAKYFKALIEPIENNLKYKAETLERFIEEEKQRVGEERRLEMVELLGDYHQDIIGYSVGRDELIEMTPEQFDESKDFLLFKIAQYNDKLAKEEAERLARIAAEEARQKELADAKEAARVANKKAEAERQKRLKAEALKNKRNAQLAEAKAKAERLEQLNVEEERKRKVHQAERNAEAERQRKIIENDPKPFCSAPLHNLGNAKLGNAKPVANVEFSEDAYKSNDEYKLLVNYCLDIQSAVMLSPSLTGENARIAQGIKNSVMSILKAAKGSIVIPK